MSQLKKIVDVGGRKYSVGLCSASEQWEILQLFGKHSAQGVAKALSLGSPSLASVYLIGDFMEKISPEELDRLSFLLLQDCIDVESDQAVKVDDFHCQMMNFSLLHIEALKANFEDFSSFLSQPQKEEVNKAANK